MQVGVMAAVGKAFGLTILQSVRAGLLLAAGGEFAFVTFGEAVSHKILPQALVSKLFLIVSLSMALTPFLAEFGQRLGKMFEKSDFKVVFLALILQPVPAICMPVQHDICSSHIVPCFSIRSHVYVKQSWLRSAEGSIASVEGLCC